MDETEALLRERIEKLRTEADTLERALKDILTTRARKTGAARRSGADQPRAGAWGAIFEAIRTAGPEGMTLDEMERVAEAEGYEVKRPTLRSQVWKAKEEGQLIQLEPGRYRWFQNDFFADVKLPDDPPPLPVRPRPTRPIRESSSDPPAGPPPATFDDEPEAIGELDDEIPF